MLVPSLLSNLDGQSGISTRPLLRWRNALPLPSEVRTGNGPPQPLGECESQ